jgi:hypothetical protein
MAVVYGRDFMLMQLMMVKGMILRHSLSDTTHVQYGLDEAIESKCMFKLVHRLPLLVLVHFHQ